MKSLKNNHEVIGTLTKVVVKEDFTTLVFAMELQIEIPFTALSQDLPYSVEGKHAGVYNKSDDYKIRE